MSLPLQIGDLTPEEQIQVLEEARRRFGCAWAFTSIEDLLTSPEGFGLTTATPLQRAICRILQGRPLAELAQNPTVQGALGNAPLPDFAGLPPEEVMVIAAVRTAKSMMAAAASIWASQTCDLTGLTQGEIPRYAIVSLELDNAKVVLAHLLGALQKPALGNLRVSAQVVNQWGQLIDETGSDVVGSVFVWHPSGRPVEIRIVAGKRAGGSVVSRWLIGLCLDEAPRMVGSGDGIINYDDTRRGAYSRIRPGATILSIGSPWQPRGPVFDRVQEFWGAPSPSLVIVKATGPAMNPVWWNPTRCAKIRVSDPTVYKTDVLAEFADAAEQLIPQVVLKKCIRDEPEVLLPEPRFEYVAAMDPATRGNAWTLTLWRRRGRVKQQCLAKEWRGSTLEPLKPREVIGEIRDTLTPYELDWLYTDQWSADAMLDIADECGLKLVVEDWTKQERTDCFLSMATAMADGTVELCPNRQQEKDLRLVEKRPSTGGVTIVLPQTPDGRHCDYAPTAARALKRWIDEELPAPIEPGSPEYHAQQDREIWEKQGRRIEEAKARPFWAKKEGRADTADRPDDLDDDFIASLQEGD